MAENKKITNFTILFLVVLLVGVAFFAGTTWMKVKNLEQESKRAREQEEKIVQVSPAPEQEGVLAEDQIAKIQTGGAAVKGEEAAPITIVEFSDYQCPFCQRYFAETYPKIWEEYEGKIRYIFRDYPLPFHPHAQQTAEAARCAGDQGKYWEMHDLLFTKQDEWTPKQDIKTNLTTYAQKIDLNITEFSSCLSSGKYTAAVKEDFALGESVGVSGTPSFFINGKMLVGAQPFASFKSLIDLELSK
jgi:protein-disulfide isomerase